MRKVTIYTSQGATEQVVETDVLLWGELQSVFDEKSVSYSGMKAVVGNTRNTLESPQAVLPEGDFILFLMTKKNKSGIDSSEIKTMGYKELRTVLKSILDSSEDKKVRAERMKFFADGDKNYTQTGTEYMRKRLLAWIKKFGIGSTYKATKSIKASTKKATAKIEKKKEPKKEQTLLEMALGLIDNYRENEILTNEETDKVDNIYGNLNELIQEIDSRKQAEIEAEKKAEEEKKAKEEQRTKVKEEMRKLAREFNDVRDI